MLGMLTLLMSWRKNPYLVEVLGGVDAPSERQA
jgi:hypothetical protein